MRWKAGARPISPAPPAALGHAQRLHLLDEEGCSPVGVAQRHQFDVDVGLALRRVVQVQHTLALAATPRRAPAGSSRRPGRRAR
jgi:hypothetical protein